MERAKGDNGILAYDQYAEIEKRGFHMPYVVEIRLSGKHMLFYGSDHLTDPEHPQFEDIEARWERFIASSASPIALVEGHFDETPESETGDREQSIMQGGEAQFVVYLARKAGVAIVSPEPDRVWEANELAKEFGREQVIFFYCMRQISWWKRVAQTADVQAHITKMLGLMKTTYHWNDVAFTAQRMAEIHQELFGKTLPWHEKQWFHDLVTPVPQDHVTNRLARRSGELRDEYILMQIMHYWRQGKSPFAVFGSAHAIRLEPALHKALT